MIRKQKCENTYTKKLIMLIGVENIEKWIESNK